MSVFRVEKNGNFTVMSNHHLKDPSLSLKAKGLLSIMLSLPDNWDYSLRGLAALSKDGIDSVSSTVNSLIKAGYVMRSRTRATRGRLSDVEYTVYEFPQKSHISQGFSPKRDFPVLVNPPDSNSPNRSFPDQVNPKQVSPYQENAAQLNTYRLNTNLINNESINHSLDTAIDRMIEDVRNRIGYRELLLDCNYETELVDSIVELIVETESSRSLYTRIGTRDVSTSLVKRKLRDLTPDIVRDGAIEPYYKYTMDNSISNPRALMLSFLYNATATYGLGNLASEAQAAAVSVRTHIPD